MQAWRARPVQEVDQCHRWVAHHERNGRLTLRVSARRHGRAPFSEEGGCVNGAGKPRCRTTGKVVVGRSAGPSVSGWLRKRERHGCAGMEEGVKRAVRCVVSGFVAELRGTVTDNR